MRESEKTAVTVSTHEELDVLKRQCQAFLQSRLLPQHIKTVAQAYTIAAKGRELGIPPLQAFASISVINGTPALSATLMLALVYQRVPAAVVNFKTPPEKAHLECEVEMARSPGHPLNHFKFTIEDAKRAKIYRNVWLTYPAAMLRARAVSAGCRNVFPDAIMGCYTPEELESIEPPKKTKVEDVTITATSLGKTPAGKSKRCAVCGEGMRIVSDENYSFWACRGDCEYTEEVGGDDV